MILYSPKQRREEYSVNNTHIITHSTVLEAKHKNIEDSYDHLSQGSLDSVACERKD